jgi:hypothetical protein
LSRRESASPIGEERLNVTGALDCEMKHLGVARLGEELVRNRNDAQCGCYFGVAR